ncbi:TPA: hypothetical protein RTG57_001732 [Campylobacter jejuni]|nr:hypothetical protein [Campylobacter jejuni]HDZ5057804.1 hypothetical protein [Campylobacter jejuni]
MPNEVKIDRDLLVRIKNILTQVDNLAQKTGHPKRTYIRQTLRDLIFCLDIRS